jgi:hypothetical protein
MLRLYLTVYYVTHSKSQEIWNETKLIDKVFANYDVKTAPFAGNCTESTTEKFHIGLATVVQRKFEKYSIFILDFVDFYIFVRSF